MISMSRRVKKILVMVLRLAKNSETAFMTAAEESAKGICSKYNEINDILVYIYKNILV